MNTQTKTALTISRVLRASRQTVFEAWTQPRHLERWSAPEGVTVTSAEVDLRVGGRYRIHMHAPDDKKFTATGTYKEIDPPRRLSYTWMWEEGDHDVGETLVTVEFNDLGGSTEVVLTHERFPNAEATAAHEQGWGSCLNRLETMFAT